MGSKVALFPSVLACCFVGALAAPTATSRQGGVFQLQPFFPSWRRDDQYYNVNLTFNGQKLPVLLDTGSGDLFVADSNCNVVNQASGCYLCDTFQIEKSTVISSNETFGTIAGTGAVAGVEGTLDVSFANGVHLKKYKVPLIDWADQDELQQGTFSGIWGLGPRNVSRNYFFHNYLPPVDQMIGEGLLANPLFSLTLPRLGDPQSVAGKLSVGGIEKLTQVKNISYNDIIDNVNYNYGIDGILAPQSWTVELQGIRVNGQEISVQKGDIDPAGRYLSLMDTGNQKLSFRRQELAEIIAAFNGPTLINGNDFYYDCSKAQVVELRYHNTWFPIDPLDMIIPSNHGLVNGTQLCLAPITAWDRTFADSIIGVPFLRNVLSVYDYVSTDLYSVQPRLGLASITDINKAKARFASVYKNRLL